MSLQPPLENQMPIAPPNDIIGDTINEKHDKDILTAHQEDVRVGPGADLQGQALDTGLKFTEVQRNAIEAELFELNLTNWQAFKLYRKGVFWAIVASFSIIMEGYDTSVTGSYTALPVFREYFGTYYPDIDEWQIPASWQSALGVAGLLGNYIGIPFAAWVVERYGYRRALQFFYVMIMPLIFIQAFAKNLGMLFAGGLLVGIPFGAFSTLACGYASEVCPPKLRGYLTGWINICWVLGILMGTGIANAILKVTTVWGFRIGYMTQWIWPIPLFIFMQLAPDAPWWCVRKNKIQDAETSMKRLCSPQMHDHVPPIVQNMVRTYQLEVDVSAGSRWIDCFKGTDLRRTEIACWAFMNQSLCGDPFGGQQIYFLQQAGVSDDLAFLLGFINYVIVLVGCFVCFLAMSRIGRRTLYLYGMFFLMIGLLIIGGLQKATDHGTPAAKWGMAIVLIAWNVWRVITIGPTCYSVVSESSSSRLRNKTIGLARIAYQIVGLVAQFVEPQLINPSALDLKGYTAWCWAPVCFIGFLWCYFRLPEFKDRSYYELDVLFERRISARKFASTNVEALADDEIREQRHINQHL